MKNKKDSYDISQALKELSDTLNQLINSSSKGHRNKAKNSSHINLDELMASSNYASFPGGSYLPSGG